MTTALPIHGLGWMPETEIRRRLSRIESKLSHLPSYLNPRISEPNVKAKKVRTTVREWPIGDSRSDSPNGNFYTFQTATHCPTIYESRREQNCSTNCTVQTVSYMYLVNDHMSDRKHSILGKCNKKGESVNLKSSKKLNIYVIYKLNIN